MNAQRIDSLPAGSLCFHGGEAYLTLDQEQQRHLDGVPRLGTPRFAVVHVKRGVVVDLSPDTEVTRQSADPAAPRLFMWRSDMLKCYQRGHIIILANDVHHAREEALRLFEAWAPQQDESWGWDEDEPARRLATLRKDLEQPPEDLNGLFIYGSD